MRPGFGSGLAEVTDAAGQGWEAGVEIISGQWDSIPGCMCTARLWGSCMDVHRPDRRASRGCRKLLDTGDCGSGLHIRCLCGDELRGFPALTYPVFGDYGCLLVFAYLFLFFTFLGNLLDT